MKNAKFDTAFIDLEGTDLLSSPVIDYEKFLKAISICNMVVITNFLIDGVKQPSIPVELEKDDDDYIIFYLTHYKVAIGDEEVIVSDLKTTTELENEIKTTGITNAKPIYCHPISILKQNLCRVTCMIFNNSPTPFTLATFKTFIDELYEVNPSTRIMMSGAYNSGDTAIIASYLAKSGDNSYSLYGLDYQGQDAYKSGSFDTVFPSTFTFSDGVNKIN